MGRSPRCTEPSCCPSRPPTERIVEESGFHPAGNLTRFHTGHAFGLEGYETVAYEIAGELGVPAS